MIDFEIIAGESKSGDPLYWTFGHVNKLEFLTRVQDAEMKEFGISKDECLDDVSYEFWIENKDNPNWYDRVLVQSKHSIPVTVARS